MSFEGVHTVSFEINGSKGGLLGENGTEIECSYTQKNIKQIYFVSFNAFNRKSRSFQEIAIYSAGGNPELTPVGQYLKGRVTLTQLLTKAVMTFNKLMCIDDTFYKCKMSYRNVNGTQEQISNNISISVQGIYFNVIFNALMFNERQTTS